MPRKKYLPYDEARLVSRSLNLKSYREWIAYCKSGLKPDNIPTYPRDYYEGRGWVNSRDWLGPKYRSFEEARTFVQSLGLADGNEWEEYSRSGTRPSDIPLNPDRQYKNLGWAGIRDWIGSKYQSFEDARSYVQTLEIKNQAEWSKYCRSGDKPPDIPASPGGVYVDKGWISWGDWLGTGYVATNKRMFWSYEDARDYVRGLGIKTLREWKEYTKSDKRPEYIPSSPSVVYEGKGWVGVGDWLGTGVIAHQNREWAPFQEARAFVRSLNLKIAWRKYCKSSERPINIPTDPARIYKDQGWAGMPDWLGTK